MSYAKLDDLYDDKRKMRRRPTINQPMKREVARRYGCEPGGRATIGCVYCGDPITISWDDPKKVRFLDSLGRSRPELDHVQPLAGGGAHTADNLVPACLWCNRSKCAHPLTENTGS